MKIYSGVRHHDGTTSVFVTETKDELTPVRRTLDPMTSLVNHSPSGLEWGYAGSGPAQLALALCCDYLGKDVLARATAVAIYQAVKNMVVAKFDGRTWMLYEEEMRIAVEEAKKEVIARGSRLPD
jgi:hypothetical protein